MRERLLFGSGEQVLTSYVTSRWAQLLGAVKMPGIFKENRYLYGKTIRVTYESGLVVTGFWSDWFDEDDNDYLADFGDDPCESIVLDRSDAPWGTITEVLETEIVKIEAA